MVTVALARVAVDDVIAREREGEQLHAQVVERRRPPAGERPPRRLCRRVRNARPALVPSARASERAARLPGVGARGDGSTVLLFLFLFLCLPP